MKIINIKKYGLLFGLMATGSQVAVGGGYEFTIFEGPEGTTATRAFGINEQNQVVGDYVDAAGEFHGFLYQNGELTTIDLEGDTTAWGINDLGQIVATSGNIGVLIEPDGVTMSDIVFPGAAKTLPLRINDNGVITGRYHDSDDIRTGFIRDLDGNYSSISDSIPGVYVVATEVLDMDNAGNVVGTFREKFPDNDEHDRESGYLLSPEGEFTRVDLPGAHETFTWGNNDLGQVAGLTIDDFGVHAFVMDTAETALGRDVSIQEINVPNPDADPNDPNTAFFPITAFFDINNQGYVTASVGFGEFTTKAAIGMPVANNVAPPGSDDETLGTVLTELRELRGEVKADNKTILEQVKQAQGSLFRQMRELTRAVNRVISRWTS